MTAIEFRTAVRVYRDRIPAAPTRRDRSRLLAEALDLHVRQRQSITPFFTLHVISPLAYDLLLTKEQRGRVLEQIELYPESLEHFLTWKHEMPPDDPLFGRALELVLPMREHRSRLHIPLRDCRGCFGELVAVEIALGSGGRVVM